MSANTKDNKNKSPIIGEYGVMASPDELTALTLNMKSNFIKAVNSEGVNLHDTEDVKRAILEYIDDCARAGKRPGNMGLYRALGLTRQDVNNILTGKSKSKASPDCIDIIQKTLLLLSEYREQLGAQGKLNPVTMIFWQKNFDNLTDVQHVELAARPATDPQLSPDEIQKQIEKDIPIDIE